MKTYLLAAALIIGAPAIAQDTTPPAAGAQAPMTDPAAPATPNDAAPAAPDAATPAPAAPGADAMTPPPAAPMAGAPAAAPMASDPAAGGMASGGGMAMTPQPSTKTYPKCSRTVKDNCVNARGK